MNKNKVEMAWNEPGGSNGKDPWGTKGDGQGPPDLDEVVRKLQEKLSGIFGGGKGGGSGSGASLPVNTGRGIGLIVIIALIVWGLSGFYIIEQGNRGVVLRLGQYLTTTEAGLRWHIPVPIEQVKVFNVEQIQNVQIGYRSDATGQRNQPVPRESLMLTQDENIIDINFAVQYKIKDAKDYLFQIQNADTEFKQADILVRQATESAVREVIGKSTMDFALKEGRTEVSQSVEGLVQGIIDRYKSGLQITSVNMQNAQPPEQVQGAFNDAIKAGQDQDRLKNEGEAYANDILPKARGASARLLEEASAYKAQVVARAEGEVSRFLNVLAEYKKAPEVTRERLYIDSIENVMSNSTKVFMDVDGSGNLLYLPLDKLMQQSGSGVAPSTSLLPQSGITQSNTRRSSSSPSSSSGQRLREAVRNREIR